MAKKLEYINAKTVQTLLEAFYPNEEERETTEAYKVFVRLKRLAGALANYKETVASMADSDTRKKLYNYCNSIEYLVGDSYDTLSRAIAKDLADKAAGTPKDGE